MKRLIFMGISPLKFADGRAVFRPVAWSAEGGDIPQTLMHNAGALPFVWGGERSAEDHFSQVVG
jgi:hypothetical protein